MSTKYFGTIKYRTEVTRIVVRPPLDKGLVEVELK
jgi:hypothetical protein